ncbi:hypothetical protein VTL71DRAFT_3047, partial [Oculimacula yallundae]
MRETRLKQKDGESPSPVEWTGGSAQVDTVDLTDPHSTIHLPISLSSGRYNAPIPGQRAVTGTRAGELSEGQKLHRSRVRKVREGT